ncbi:MAG: division/cell wall cluster transcriptional repressor MraZ [Ferruginibacter sp.]
MSGFVGEYESTIDAKGRFLLPAGLKKQLPEKDNHVFVISRGFEKCLALYTQKSWETLYKEMSQVSDFNPRVRKFQRYFLNGAIQVEMDSAGRLLLPKNLLDYASLGKDIVLASAVNKIEIWDKNKHTEFFESFSPEEFSDLADEVMNKRNDNPPARGLNG